MVIFLFWLGVMALTLMALGLLLPPLLRTNLGGDRRGIERELATLKGRLDTGEIDATTHASERERLSAALVATVEGATPPPARMLATVLALALPAAALGLYFLTGRPDALDPPAERVATAMPQDLGSAVTGLEARLRENPDDATGWLLLARSYRAMERFDDMLRATSSAYQLAPNEPDVLVEHAEALALSSTRRLEGESRHLLEQALTTDSAHQKTLWLLGVSELQRGNNTGAVDYWQRLRALLPDGDSVAASVDVQIAAAKSRMTNDATAVAPAALPSASPDSSVDQPQDGPQLLVTIDIDDALKPHVNSRDILFVFVRAPNGGPPLAIRRIESPAFPISVTLTQTDRMLEGMQIETGAEVSVGARLSKTGQAQAQAGDLEAHAQHLTLAPVNTLTLRIDQVIAN